MDVSFPNVLILSKRSHIVANINLHKLDAAFDIDPLFHKMSKAFDEGGAKGLLLANLGVGTNGCNIVFDSTLEEPDEQGETKEHQEDFNHDLVDVTSLKSKLQSLLGDQPIEALPLVPQLASLRAEYAELEAQGFVEHIKKVIFLLSIVCIRFGIY